MDIADPLAKRLACIAIDAGAAIMAIYSNQDTNKIGALETKSDGSFVTEADHAAEEVIVSALRQEFPDIQIIAEEACYKTTAQAPQARFFLVDALDGTSEYIGRRPEFTVNIALIEHNMPIAGVVYSPASGELYIGGSYAYSGKVKPRSKTSIQKNSFAKTLPKLTRIYARDRQNPITAVVSRTHLDEQTTRFLESYKIEKTLAVGSSIKFCRVAEGLADIYPRFSPTMEWDTAAGHAIVIAAGGIVLMPDGQPLTYGKVGYKNGSFIAWGK